MITRNPCLDRFDKDHRDCLICEGYQMVRAGEKLMVRGIRARREASEVARKLTTVKRRA